MTMTKTKPTTQAADVSSPESAIAPTSTGPAEPPTAATIFSLGDFEDVEADDVVLSKLFLMQGLSKKVAAREADAGEFRDSESNALICARGESFEFLVVGARKLYFVFRLVQKGNNIKREFLRVEPYDFKRPRGKQEPFRDAETGELCEKDFVYNFNLLVLGDKFAYDFPRGVNFTRTSTHCGKAIFSEFLKASQAKKQRHEIVFRARTVDLQNESGAWYGWHVVGSRFADEAEAARGAFWSQFVARQSQEKLFASASASEHDAPASSESGAFVAPADDDSFVVP